MGNYRFRLSDMIPNSWFYKLKDSKKKPPVTPVTPPPPKPKQPQPESVCSRKSYYFGRELGSNDVSYFPEPPRKSSKQQQHRAGRRKPSTRSTAQSVSSNKSESAQEFTTEIDDIVIHLDKQCLAKTTTKYDEVAGAGVFDSLPALELPPIVTKKRESRERTSPAKKLPANSPGVRLRIHSPKIGNRKIKQQNGRRSVSSRRSLSDSLAVIKSSYDPQRDFRESMVEMIVENNIRASKDLEDLLACYLSLNADEYHDLIIKVFKQIWFDLTVTTR